MDRAHRYRPILFFAATLILTWVPWFVAIAIQEKPGMESTAGLLNLLGLLAPMVMSLVLILGSGSRALRADFRSRLLDVRRIEPRYLLIAILMPAVVMVASIGVSLGFGQSADQLRFSTSANLVGTIVLTMVLAPIIEELGWRGYGVDSLRAGMPMLRSTLVFAVLWSLWHAPLVLVRGTYHYELAQMDNPVFLANFFLGVIPAAVVANWLYYKNRRSILAGIVLHATLNGAAVLLSAGQVAKTIVSVFFLGIAIALVILDRPTFDAGPRDFVREPATP